MNREEAIFCEKSYIGETNCTDCKYYGTETCQSRESHKMAIKALEQEPRWIPVSERLPDKNKYDKGAVWERSVLVTAYFSWDSSKHTFISTKLAEDVVANNFVDECIVAWMPLPIPYEPQESEQ